MFKLQPFEPDPGKPSEKETTLLDISAEKAEIYAFVVLILPSC